MFKHAFISCDHTGIELCGKIKELLNKFGIETVFFEITEKEDYTDAAKKVCKEVSLKNDACGILVCGSGVGISISANKIKGIRAALCHLNEVCELARKHNDANVLCLGARIVSTEKQLEFVKTFITTQFEGGRHEVRVNKIEA